ERSLRAALQSDADHQTAPPDLADAESGQPVPHEADPTRADLSGALGEPAGGESIQRGEGRRARERRSEVRRRVKGGSAMLAPRGHHPLGAEASADGKTAPEALSQAHEIRLDPGIHARQPCAAPPQARPDLV